ncbi:uncharacterized protein LOC106664673 [Cimex lectularius]|uniref:Kinetochore-associated protein 1 n=1 Tax=Cimex lectularius TaxID=79782 RepID=A0A8I6RH15_CIMLE|nr:uncharacterized protein LOC106664673 [Cimex lectularius]
MSCWSNVVTGFNANDETINFGSRPVALVEDSVYETKTVATIESSSKVSDTTIESNSKEIENTAPLCRSFYLKNYLGLTLDKTFLLFNDLCTTVIINHSFDNVIDAFHITGDGKFSFFALASFELFCMDLTSPGKIVFKTTLPCSPEKPDKVEQLISKQSDIFFNLYILFSSGKILKLPLEDIPNYEGNNESKTNLEVVNNDIVQDHNLVTAMFCYHFCDDMKALFCVGNKIALWSENAQNLSVALNLKKEYKIKKIKSSGLYIIALTMNGDLIQIGQDSFLIIHEWKNYNIIDFTFINNSADLNFDLLFITEIDIFLLEPISLTLKFKLKTGFPSFLIEGLADCEDLFYLEGVRVDNFVDTVRVKAITVHHPEFRLERLLARMKFTEAEEFAKKYNLLENVRKSKAQWLMGELHLNKVLEETHFFYTEFFSLMNIIMDDEFVGECCLKVTPPDIIKTKDVVEYAWNRLSTLPKKNPNVINLLKLLKQLLNAVSSFLLIYGESGSSEEWLNFSTKSPFIICQEFLSKGQIREAIIICKRNELQMKSVLSTETEKPYSLFEVISSDVSVEECLEWLNCYLPIVLSNHSQLLDKVINWIIKKAKYIEHQNLDLWPRKALEFSQQCSVMLRNIINSDIIEDNFSLHQGISLPSSPINILNEFSFNLHNLCILKEEFAIHIEYDSYIQYQDSQQRMVFLHLLFDYVPKHLIPTFVENFINIMFVDQCKDIDKIIANYIRRQSRDLYISNHSWEEGRCVTYIECIKDLSEKLNIIQFILPKVSIPLSSDIENLIEKIKHHNHPLVIHVLKEVSDLSKKAILKKYGFQYKSIDIDEIDTCALRIFENSGEDGLEDVKLLLNTGSTTLNIEPYRAMWMIAINKGSAQRAFSIIKDEIPPNKIILLCKSMVEYIHLSLKMRTSCDEINNCILALDNIISYCTCEGSVESRTIVDFAQNVIAIHKIQLFDKKTFNMDNMYGVHKGSVLEFCVSHLTEDVPKNIIPTENCEFVLLLKKRVSQIASDLQLKFEKCILELTSQCVIKGKIHCATFFIQLLKENNFLDSSPREVSKLLELILDIYCQAPDKDEEVASVLLDIASSLIISCASMDIKRNIDMLTICKLFVIPLQKPEWSTIYEDPFEVHQLFLTPAVGNSLLNCVRNVPAKVDNAELNNDLEKILQAIPNDLISFNYMYALTWLLLKQGEVDLKTLKKISKIASLKASAIILNMLAARSFSLNLALILLHHFQPEQAVQWLNNVTNKMNGDDLKWNNALGLLGKYYYGLRQDLKESDMLNYFNEIYIMSSWGMKIVNYGIPSKEACCDGVDGRKKLLKKLIATPGIEMDVLQQYCIDMKLDIQKCLLFYLEHVLLSWKPIFSVTKNKVGKTVLVFENDTKELLTICQRIVYQIGNEDNLTKLLLQTIWDQVNTYYYEVFLVILEIVPTKFCVKLQKYKLILNFLLVYTRVGEIQESEENEWFALNPSNQTLPEIAKYRLPLNKFPCDVVKTMKTEFTLETYNIWLTAPIWTPNTQNQDLICSFTITNLKNEDSHTNSNTWQLSSRKKDLLEKIKECLDHIKSFETAVAALYFVVNHVMPPGIDQVQAAQLCFMKAEQWAENERSEKAIVGRARAEKKYLTVSTTHILHKYGLGKPEYIKLALQPANLISVLYHDPSLLEDSLSIKPDINKAVECITALHSVNIANVTLELLTKWLDAENKESSIDYFLVDSKCKIVTTQYSDNVKRACYLLLGSKELSKVESYLIGVVFTRNHEENRKPVGIRLRALQCLTAITTAEKLQLITARSIEAIKSHMKVLEIVYQLELYGYSYTIKGFELTSKEAMVSNLLKKPTNGKLRLAAYIARCYKINKPEIWDDIAQKMVTLLMTTDLEILLPHFEEMMINQHTTKLIWARLIETAMSSEDSDKVIDLVEKSPDSSYLNVKALLQYFRKKQNQTAIKYLMSFTKD